MISVGWSSFPEQWIRKWVFFKVDSGTALWNGLNICIRTWWWTDAEWNYDLVHDVAKVGKCSLGDNARKRCSKAVRNHSALSLANIENLHHVANLKKITIIPNAFSGRRCAVASFGEVDGKRWQSNDRGNKETVSGQLRHAQMVITASSNVASRQDRVRKVAMTLNERGFRPQPMLSNIHVWPKHREGIWQTALRHV